MSEMLRWTLVALLVTSTALFAVGGIAERSDADTHSEAAEVVEHRAGAAENEGAHEDESLAGVDLESTPLVVVAVIVGLGLAVLTATRCGRLPGFLGLVAAIALILAALDVREFLHQIDESKAGIAAVAITVATLHLAAAAVSGRLARQPPAARGL